jgi:hypothetical protein
VSDFTYFRIGVPNDMVADIMWNDDFEVSMEPVTARAKAETNYQRYFGTPEKAVRVLQAWCDANRDCFGCPFLTLDTCPRQANNMSSWLESEAE